MVSDRANDRAQIAQVFKLVNVFLLKQNFLQSIAINFSKFDGDINWIVSKIKPDRQTITSKIWGDYIENFDDCYEYLRLQFSPSSLPLKQRWRNNGLSADFIADYLATFFPQFEQVIKQANINLEFRYAVSYVANELLENAMKFSDANISYPVDIILQLHRDRIIFLVNNSIPLESVETFQTFIQDLLEGNPQELYIQHLENTVDDDRSTSSGLGLLTMINDYDAKLGWKFETIESDSVAVSVTTMVQLIF